MLGVPGGLLVSETVVAIVARETPLIQVPRLRDLRAGDLCRRTVSVARELGDLPFVPYGNLFSVRGVDGHLAMPAVSRGSGVRRARNDDPRDDEQVP